MTVPTRLLMPLEPGLVLYLPFWEGSGTFAEDVTPNRNHGTIYGATWVDGKLGKALSFDGVDDRVGFATFNPSGVLNIFPLTIAAWIYYYPDSGKTYTYISNFAGGYTGWFLQKTSANSFLIAVGTGSVFVVSNKVITSEGWIHAVAVIKGVGDSVNLYVDGQPQTPATLTAYSNGYDYVNIGGHPPSGVGMKGIVDEVRIYNRALTDDEVFELYYKGARGG
jgi:hypothetical protein